MRGTFGLYPTPWRASPIVDPQRSHMPILFMVRGANAVAILFPVALCLGLSLTEIPPGVLAASDLIVAFASLTAIAFSEWVILEIARTLTELGL